MLQSNLFLAGYATLFVALLLGAVASADLPDRTARVIGWTAAGIGTIGTGVFLSAASL